MKPKRQYHTFKRILPDMEPGDPPFEVKALILTPRAPVTITLTEADIMEAIRRDGQADSQNCGGAVCVTSKENKKKFLHEVSPLVDWWRRRVYISAGTRKNGQAICYAYGHYDNIEELFDTEAGLKKLLRRVRKNGSIEINLYPVKKGYNPITGKPVRSGGPATVPGGAERKPRLIGNELRLMNYLRARELTA